ncbi:MAG: hypothetical protein AMXMBFR82_06910 [Candidatus Hydrogenedentota bacterium]
MKQGRVLRAVPCFYILRLMTYTDLEAQLRGLEGSTGLELPDARKKLQALNTQLLDSIGSALDSMENEDSSENSTKKTHQQLFEFVQDEEELFTIHTRHDGTQPKSNTPTLERVALHLRMNPRSALKPIKDTLSLIDELVSILSRGNLERLPEIREKYVQYLHLNQNQQANSKS